MKRTCLLYKKELLRVKKRVLLSLTARAVDSFDIISVRDLDSRAALKKLLPHRRILLVPDPTFLLFGKGNKVNTDEGAHERSDKLDGMAAGRAARGEEKDGTAERAPISLEDAVLGEIVRYFELSEDEKCALSELSRRTVRERYSAETMARRTLELYGRLSLRSQR